MYTKFTNGEAEISAKDPMMIRTLQSMGFREVGTAKATGATPASPATPPETPPLDRDALVAEAKELGVKHAWNAKDENIKAAIDAHKAAQAEQAEQAAQAAGTGE